MHILMIFKLHRKAIKFNAKEEASHLNEIEEKKKQEERKSRSILHIQVIGGKSRREKARQKTKRGARLFRQPIRCIVIAFIKLIPL